VSNRRNVLEELLLKLRRAMVSLDERETMRVLSLLVGENAPPREIMDSLNQSIRLVSEMFQEGTYYMAGLLLAGEITRVAMERLIPLALKKGGDEKRGLVLLGAMEGDVHELGKNLAAWFLRADGFEVEDLGVDVPPRVFLREILQREPDVVGVSLLMAESVPLVKRLVGLVREVYADKAPPPIFVGCGLLKPDSDAAAMAALADEEREWLEVERVVHDPLDAVELCRELVAKKGGG
jgi:methylmalonyl-CoA mutase cobalamin-binding domain/chain